MGWSTFIGCQTIWWSKKCLSSTVESVPHLLLSSWLAGWTNTSKRKKIVFTLTNKTFQLILGKPKLFPDWQGYVVSPIGSVLAFLFSRKWMRKHHREAPKMLTLSTREAVTPLLAFSRSPDPISNYLYSLLRNPIQPLVSRTFFLLLLSNFYLVCIGLNHSTIVAVSDSFRPYLLSGTDRVKTELH